MKGEEGGWFPVTPAWPLLLLRVQHIPKLPRGGPPGKASRIGSHLSGVGALGSLLPPGLVPSTTAPKLKLLPNKDDLWVPPILLHSSYSTILLPAHAYLC